MKADQKDKRILVLVEKENGGVGSITFELLRAGRELANSVRETTRIVTEPEIPM